VEFSTKPRGVWNVQDYDTSLLLPAAWDVARNRGQGTGKAGDFMSERKRNIALLGSTGSIGRSTIEVIEASGGRLQVYALSAHQRLNELCEQARKHRPRFVVATDETLARDFDWTGLPGGTELLIGPAAVTQLVQREEVDVVVAAMMGSAGLAGTWAAVEAGKTVALANKETLVMAGSQVMRLAAERGARILPVDSEHSAVFQLLDRREGLITRSVIATGGSVTATDGLSTRSVLATGDTPGLSTRSVLATGGLITRSVIATEEVKRIVLTASGGPFRTWTKERMEQATVTDALSHPTWQMGQKITIDSATMMNKALEIIEARWLFGLSIEQIDVVVHPQSIVHSLVEFVDGSVVAQLSPPDMRLPIQYALTWPEREVSPAKRLDLTQSMRLDFEPPDEDRFPALGLGREVAAAGGTAGAVLNAANEAAVASFLAGSMPFGKIVPACRDVLEHHSFVANPTLAELHELDAWARQEIARWILV
jgi:1-deoxy-D-xylulose-5-phosphate reductoisomerase